MWKQIILLWKPEDKSTLIEDNLDIFQKIFKAAGQKHTYKNLEENPEKLVLG
jgi:hypothetical protein